MPPNFSKHLGQVLAPPDPGMEEQVFPLPHSCHAGDGRDRLGTAQKTRGDKQGGLGESQQPWSHQSQLDPALFVRKPKPMAFTLAIDAL